VVIYSADLATPVVAGILVLSVAAVVAIWLIPRRQTRRWAARGISGKDLADLETTARGTLVQALGGVALILTFVATWMQIGDTRDATNRTLRLTADQQQTERFTRAVAQLASERPEVRIGGIYGLDDVGAASVERRRPIAQILLAYLRQRYRRSAEARRFARGQRFRAANEGFGCGLPQSVIVADDMQAALGVIVGHAETARPRFVLARLDLRYFRALGADFRQADLTSSYVIAGDLRRAHFDRATADDADFTTTCLRGASFINARLNNAQFAGANLNDADLSNSSTRGASFNWAQLRRVDLRRADLYGSDFLDADLRGADLPSTTSAARRGGRWRAWGRAGSRRARRPRPSRPSG
jgi:uncharacterized protein YjbI with pentapeptide repeats